MNGISEYDVICLPTIVVDGVLFEAKFDKANQKMKLEQVPFSRFHWRGATEHEHAIPIDIVTRDGLKDFVSNRVRDMFDLEAALSKAIDTFSSAWVKRDCKEMEYSYPRAVGSDVPEFLRYLKFDRCPLRS